jgi:hypothetical protein
MPAFRKVYVDSSFRKGGTGTNFRFEFPQTVECPGKCHVAISALNFPNLLYTVLSSVNSNLWIYQVHPSNPAQSLASTLQIPEGNYTGTTLASAILTALTAAKLDQATYSVSFNPTTLRITIQQSGGGGFIVFDSATLKQNGPIGGLAVANPMSLQDVLNVPVSGSANVTWQSGPVTVTRLTQCFLRSPNLTNFGSLDSMGRRDVLKRVLLDSPFGYQMQSSEDYQTSDLMDCSNRELTSCDFMLTDSHANILSLQGHTISFCLNFVFGELE